MLQADCHLRCQVQSVHSTWLLGGVTGCLQDVGEGVRTILQVPRKGVEEGGRSTLSRALFAGHGNDNHSLFVYLLYILCISIIKVVLYSNTYKLIQYFTVFYNFINFVLNLNSPAYYTYILISHIISLSSFCTHFVLFSFIYSMERRHFFATPFTCYMATIGSICCWTYHHVVSLSHDQSLFVHFALYFLHNLRNVLKGCIIC